MNIIYKYSKILLLAILLATASAFVLSGDVSAQTGNNNCEVDTSIVSCDDRLDSEGNVKEGLEGTGLWSMLLLGLNILTGLVGVVAVAAIVFGSIMYSSAGGNQEQVKKASGIIRNVVVAVIIFGLMWSTLNFLIPGGVFAD